jgi:hypothetical protein
MRAAAAPAPTRFTPSEADSRQIQTFARLGGIPMASPEAERDQHPGGGLPLTRDCSPDTIAPPRTTYLNT